MYPFVLWYHIAGDVIVESWPKMEYKARSFKDIKHTWNIFFKGLY